MSGSITGAVIAVEWSDEKEVVLLSDIEDVGGIIDRIGPLFLGSPVKSRASRPRFTYGMAKARCLRLFAPRTVSYSGSRRTEAKQDRLKYAMPLTTCLEGLPVEILERIFLELHYFDICSVKLVSGRANMPVFAMFNVRDAHTAQSLYE